VKTDTQAVHASRRSFLKTGLALAGAAGLGVVSSARAAQTINVTCWGGDYETGIREIFATPFAAETGIAVRLINNADLAKMKAQIDSKNVQWDVFDSIGPQITAGAKQGLWMPIDEKIVNRSDLISKGGVDYVGTYLFAGGIGWDPKRFAQGKHPSDFKEFWDVKRFPGKRGLRPRISENLEMALVADGVAPNKLYPLDVERGFKALDRIKPNIQRWIETTPETITLISNQEVDFDYTYLSRVLPAQKNGTSVQFSLAQTINSLEYLAVPKGCPNPEAAMKYITFCLRPDRQAAFSSRLNFAPNTRSALPMLDKTAKAILPDLTNPRNVILDDAWWADNYDTLQKRFTEWMLV
jgi:putative spermidine/putrescine transport system substrate-binding protein